MIRALAWVWMGIVIGVSFLATPVKFTADSLSRAAALDVGRATFHALGLLEWGLTVALAALLWRAAAAHQAPSRRALTAAAVVAAVVVLQALWLVPALDERVASIIAGVEPPPSQLHTVYGIAEVIKVTTLWLLGLWASPIPTAERAGTSSGSKTKDQRKRRP
ncbi:MAG: DUF4149 domain-containing protein [Acidimicrobiales bacterium]